MIEFKLDIDKFPDDLNWDYSLTAGVEGSFLIEINGIEVFKAEEFLIMEFFFEFHRWLRELDSSKPSNFYFVSMDEEEEPLIAFFKDEDTGSYIFDSVWKLAVGRASIGEITDAYHALTIEIEKQLLHKYQYKLKL